MIIGVPREIKDQEYRVALLPSAAYQLAKRGHQVVVERGAGVGAGYPDAQYEQAGAKLVDSHAGVFEQGELIVKVKEPLPVEYELLRPGQLLFTYLHLAASKSLTEALMKSGVTGIAYETIEVNRRLPLLEPMSEIAGRMSVLVGGYFLAKHFGGSGVLLGGVPGVLPGKVVVLGGGASGINAARKVTHGAEIVIGRASFYIGDLTGRRVGQRRECVNAIAHLAGLDREHAPQLAAAKNAYRRIWKYWSRHAVLHR